MRHLAVLKNKAIFVSKLPLIIISHYKLSNLKSMLSIALCYLIISNLNLDPALNMLIYEGFDTIT